MRTTAAESTLSVSYLAFLTIATLLAAVAIINDSAILTIGAMVLGPEFAPLAALAVAVVHGRRSIARRAGVTLVAGFVVAIGLTALAAQKALWRRVPRALPRIERVVRGTGSHGSS